MTAFTHHHDVYGLRLGAHRPLGGLAPSAPGEVDLEILSGTVDPPGPAAVRLPLGLWLEDPETTASAVGFEVPDVGRFLVREGNQIVVDARTGVPDDVVDLFVLGTALGVALVQRGHLVLHGNSFVVGDGCAVVLGHSGAGKSTFAAEVHRRGLPVLSDDVVPLDGSGRALPGFARIKLWRDAAERLGVTTTGLRRVREGHDKFHLPIERAATEPQPVRRLYVLEYHDAPLRLEPVVGAEVFALLHEHTYRREVIVGAHRGPHLRRCAELAARTELVRVLRPAGRDSVASSVDAVLADLADSADPADSADVAAMGHDGTPPAPTSQEAPA